VAIKRKVIWIIRQDLEAKQLKVVGLEIGDVQFIHETDFAVAFDGGGSQGNFKINGRGQR
jgi:hypothetical protein